MVKVIEMNCPGCGARVQINQKQCEWCHAPVVITSMSDIFSMNTPDINKYSKSYEDREYYLAMELKFKQALDFIQREPAVG